MPDWCARIQLENNAYALFGTEAKKKVLGDALVKNDILYVFWGNCKVKRNQLLIKNVFFTIVLFIFKTTRLWGHYKRIKGVTA